MAKLRGARLGQHFLMHPRIAERIVAVAGVGPTDTVLEVGPGKGMLTKALLAKAGWVIAVEADGALLRGLRERFASEIAAVRLELVHCDIRTYVLPATPYHVVANIPYYITGEIIRLFLEAERQPSSMTLLVQKEVAERIARAKKGSILSLSVEAYGDPTYEFTVPRGAFRPAPKVDSAVLSIRSISRRHFASAEEEQRLFALLHAGFAHKRKKLAKNLVETGFEAVGLPEHARAEDLSLKEWLALAQKA